MARHTRVSSAYTFSYTTASCSGVMPPGSQHPDLETRLQSLKPPFCIADFLVRQVAGPYMLKHNVLHLLQKSSSAAALQRTIANIRIPCGDGACFLTRTDLDATHAMLHGGETQSAISRQRHPGRAISMKVTKNGADRIPSGATTDSVRASRALQARSVMKGAWSRRRGTPSSTKFAVEASVHSMRLPFSPAWLQNEAPSP